MITRLKRETRYMPGIGEVSAVIREGVRDNDTVFLRLLTEAKQPDGQPVNQADIEFVRTSFNAE